MEKPGLMITLAAELKSLDAYTIYRHNLGLRFSGLVPADQQIAQVISWELPKIPEYSEIQLSDMLKQGIGEYGMLNGYSPSSLELTAYVLTREASRRHTPQMQRSLIELTTKYEDPISLLSFYRQDQEVQRLLLAFFFWVDFDQGFRQPIDAVTAAITDDATLNSMLSSVEDTLLQTNQIPASVPDYHTIAAQMQIKVTSWRNACAGLLNQDSKGYKLIEEVAGWLQGKSNLLGQTPNLGIQRFVSAGSDSTVKLYKASYPIAEQLLASGRS